MTDVATMTPTDARRRFRDGHVAPTTGWCDGWTQANLLAVPEALAWDFLLFAQRNPKPCPVLDVLDAGETAGPLLDGDIRTDVPRYRVYVDGELVDEPTDVTRWWQADLVSFLVGCSFTFEAALREESVPVRHIEQGTNVPMYRTSVRCRAAGAVSGPLVVSMRPVPADLVAAAVRVTSRYPSVHGAPVHVGDPDALGIADLDRPDFGDVVRLEPGDVPVFWACGVTPQAAVMESRPSLAIAHAPGHMLVTDARNSAYQVP
ncbi:putative hydro-lyase [Solicola gregarius]|uniref:Putative hydro-lyase L0C25_02320 n=1 Tax=Solicola gregarius TaxID=2908642 RepID=A0AA46TJD0_9ACTN|nr:putative hydro-lyase [Solicola gregarius]UYM05929.1 putative hydro-lyase [Solicola gregarius]